MKGIHKADRVHPGGYLIHKYAFWLMMFVTFIAGLSVGFVLGLYAALS